MSDIYAKANAIVFGATMLIVGLAAVFALLAWLADLLERETETPEINLDLLDFKPRKDR